MVQTKWLVFTQLQAATKTKQWRVNSKSGAVLGMVSFYPQWRKYVFRPYGNTVYDANCLQEIIAHLDDQNALRQVQEKSNGKEVVANI